MAEPLLARARALAAAAGASGALEPLGSTLHRVDGFEVRVLDGFERKPHRVSERGGAPRSPHRVSGRGGAPWSPHRAGRGDPAPDPFRPPYPAALHVTDWPPEHAILLNRYPVLGDHLLLVTLADLPQEEPASARDLEALDRLLAEVDGLGFYNGGVAAGASQPHRHLQLVGRAALGELPLEAAIAGAVAAGAGRVPSFPFPHAIGPAGADPDALLAATDRDPRAPGPHSLLITRGWRMVVPRSAGVVRGMPVNSLAYVGLMAVKSPAQLEDLRRIGPWTILQEAAG